MDNDNKMVFVDELEERDELQNEKVNTDNSGEGGFEKEPISKVDNIKISINSKRKWWILIVVVVVLLVGGIVGGKHIKNNSVDITTSSTLLKAVRVNELSTYRVVYNGITKKYIKDDDAEDKNKKKIAYYVSYESKVEIGIDAMDIDIKEEDGKKMVVYLPEVKINDYDVSMSSLDFLFTDSDSDAEDVSSEAYKLCVKDVKKQIKLEKEIKRTAKKNAERIVKGLLEPIVEDEGYTIEVK